MAQRTIKARYRVTGPKLETVRVNKCIIDDTGSLKQQMVDEECETFMVHFPQGHSIRVLFRERLVEMGYHIRPRMVDMETGDVVDVGGDPYDFGGTENIEITHLVDDEDTLGNSKMTRKRAETAQT